MKSFSGKHAEIPELTKEALTRYVNDKIPTGGFLIAVLSNNLFEAMARADEINKEALPLICSYIYNEMPIRSWGSEEKVLNWLNVRETK